MTEDESAPAGEKPDPKGPLAFLAKAVQTLNLIDLLDDEQVNLIGHDTCTEYEIDKRSRSDWEKRIEAAIDLAMLVSERKDYPFKQASNVKYPLLTTAALQFNARAYPAIVQGNRVAKCSTWGRDPQGMKAARAERVSEHLSYQLLTSPEWEEDTDKLLLIVPIVGCAFRKVYYDPSLRRNCTRLITADRLVINYHARSMEDAPRLTEMMNLYPYEIEERIRSARFAEFNYKAVEADQTTENQGETDTDTSAPHLFLEQHRLIDLDGDGYPEPYVVTVHHASQTVVRIAANFQPADVNVERGKVVSIRRQNYYIKYPFLPSPDGGIYGWGFGWLLKDIGEAINTTVNQMMDAGHLANVQGGLVSAGLGIKEKTIRLHMGEFRVLNTSVPLKDAVMPLTFPGPSDVLFKLLGMLIEAGKEIGAVKDVLTGETPANAPVGTTLALIEQGLQVFTSIYKRIHRAIKSELALHAELNRKHITPETYARFFDDPAANPQTDYADDDMDILPVSDPNTVSKMQTLQKAMFLMELSDKDIASGMPMLNRQEVYARVLEAAQIEERETLIMQPPPPNPEEEILKRAVAMLALEDQEAEILQKRTAALKNVADAESKEEGTQLAAIQAYLQFLTSQIEAKANGQGRVSGVEGQPAQPTGPQTSGGALGGVGVPMQGLPLQPNGGIPGGLGGAPAEGGL